MVIIVCTPRAWAAAIIVGSSRTSSGSPHWKSRTKSNSGFRSRKRSKVAASSRLRARFMPWFTGQMVQAMLQALVTSKLAEMSR